MYAIRGQCNIVLTLSLPDMDCLLTTRGGVAALFLPGVITMTVVDLVLTVLPSSPLSWLQNRPWLLGPGPLVFLFSPAWKQYKAETGGTQNGLGTRYIVPRASSSTFLGWLGSGPPVQGYCSNSTAPPTWPQLTAAASTDHCGAQAEWWLSLPHQSSLSLCLSDSFSDSYQDLLPQPLWIFA